MDNTVVEGDRLYLIAESLAQDHSLLPSADANDAYGGIRGLLTPLEIARENDILDQMDIDSYIERVVAPAETQGRLPAPEVIRSIGRGFALKAELRADATLLRTDATEGPRGFFRAGAQRPNATGPGPSHYGHRLRAAAHRRGPAETF